MDNTGTYTERNNILEERGKLYGDFKKNMNLIIRFKREIRILEPIQNSSKTDFIKNMIALKLTRIAVTGYDFEGASKDSYLDLINYIALFNTLKYPYHSILGGQENKFQLEKCIDYLGNPNDITPEMVKEFCEYVVKKAGTKNESGDK